MTRSPVKERALEFMATYPGFDELGPREQNRRLYEAFGEVGRSTLRRYKSEFYEEGGADRFEPGGGAVPSELVPSGGGSAPSPGSPDFPGGGGARDLEELASRDPPDLLEEGVRRLLVSAVANLGDPDADPRWGQLIYRLAEGSGSLEALGGGGGDEEWLSRAGELEVDELVADMLPPEGGEGPSPGRSGTSGTGPSGGTTPPSPSSSPSSDSPTGSSGGSGGT